MKNTKKLISLISFLFLIVILAVMIITSVLFTACSSKDESDVDWKTALENFLTQFPTLLDETALFEAVNGIVHPIDADGIYVPGGYRFQDLDGDNIPEAIISFGPPESEIAYDKVYKLYDGAYEQIAQDKFAFYTDKNGKLAAEIRFGYMAGAVYSAEIIDKKLILNDYIDSKGSDTYDGVKYNNLQDLYQIMDIWSAQDLDPALRPLPDIDCSAIVKAARDRAYNANDANGKPDNSNNSDVFNTNYK